MTSKATVFVNKKNRSSFSSEELNTLVDNAEMDSIQFTKPTIPSAISGIAAITSPSSSTKQLEEAPEYIKNLMLASKALARIDNVSTARRLRRVAFDIGVYKDKLAFAIHFQDQKLPDELTAKIEVEKCYDYAVEMSKAAIKELENLGKKDEVAKIKPLLPELREAGKVEDPAEKWQKV